MSPLFIGGSDDSAWRSRAWSPPAVANIRGNVEVDGESKADGWMDGGEWAASRFGGNVRFERRTTTGTELRHPQALLP